MGLKGFQSSATCMSHAAAAFFYRQLQKYVMQAASIRQLCDGHYAKLVKLGRFYSISVVIKSNTFSGGSAG